MKISIFKKILEKIVCRHEWKRYYRAKIYNSEDVKKEIPDSVVDTLICQKCGKIKKVDLTQL